MRSSRPLPSRSAPCSTSHRASFSSNFDISKRSTSPRTVLGSGVSSECERGPGGDHRSRSDSPEPGCCAVGVQEIHGLLATDADSHAHERAGQRLRHRLGGQLCPCRGLQRVSRARSRFSLGGRLSAQEKKNIFQKYTPNKQHAWRSTSQASLSWSKGFSGPRTAKKTVVVWLGLGLDQASLGELCEGTAAAGSRRIALEAHPSPTWETTAALSAPP